eukprot:scaffold77952_cov48-Cyclotella_meneghiniana.AAC.4
MAVPPTTASTPRSYRGMEQVIKSIQTYRLKINYFAFIAASDDVKREIKERIDWREETASGIMSRQ